jgi:CheY-like chemotaxis protein
LVAEDTYINQLLVVKILETLGCQVTVVTSGRAAVEAVRRQRFDLVLMDVQMPELDGKEATVLIRQEEAGTGRHVPILALTAHAMKGDREDCLAAGMDGYLAKPVQPAQLREAVRRVLLDESAPASVAVRNA